MAPERGRTEQRTRWSRGPDKVVYPSLPTLLPCLLEGEMLVQYMRVLDIEEISRRLRVDDIFPKGPRSPSPEPIYGQDGKRVNTREARYREKLEMDRHRLIQEQTKADALYIPPSDYRKPSRLTEKIYIPSTEFPDVNFIGLLIGPRGNTLKKIERDSGGAKISIRGKGSAKSGKNEQRVQPGENEDLHALVMADSEEKLQAAVDLINRIIEDACSTPEQQNKLKRDQLLELARLNGTLREENAEMGQKRYDYPRSVRYQAICKICGGVGHIEADCLLKNDAEAVKAAAERNKQLDDDYSQFMASISKDLQSGSSAQPPSSVPTATGASASLPPWLQEEESNYDNNRMGGGGAAPWMGGGSQGGMAPWATGGMAMGMTGQIPGQGSGQMWQQPSAPGFPQPPMDPSLGMAAPWQAGEAYPPMPPMPQGMPPMPQGMPPMPQGMPPMPQVMPPMPPGDGPSPPMEQPPPLPPSDQPPAPPPTS